MPPLGSAELRLEPGGQRLQGILVGRRGERYRRRFQRLLVLLGGLVIVMMVVMTSVADLLAARLLLGLVSLVSRLITIRRNRHQRCSEIVDFVGSQITQLAWIWRNGNEFHFPKLFNQIVDGSQFRTHKYANEGGVVCFTGWRFFSQLYFSLLQRLAWLRCCYV